MPQLLLMIGLPGSGKSFLVEQLKTNISGSRLISTDAIRAQLFGDEAIQGPWLLVWRNVERQFREVMIAIEQGEASVGIYDATNVVRRQRKEAIALACSAGFTHITGIWVNTPLEVCLARNEKRDRTIPEEVILSMNRKLQDAPPALEDGLNQLFVMPPTASTEIALTLMSKNRTQFS